MGRRVNVVVIALALMSGCFLSLVSLPENSRAATLHVGGGGPGSYTSIQEAINNATSGDTVFIHGGTYAENVVVNRTIDLIGEDRETTHVLGTGTGRGIKVTADWVNISGLRVSGGSLAVGLELWGARNCTISASHFSAGYGGAISLIGAHGNSITDSTATWSSHGIFLDSSNHNMISGNDLSFNDNEGIWLLSSSFNNVEDNAVSTNGADGILLDDSDLNDVTGNNVTYNEDGITLISSSSDEIVANDLIDNSRRGVNVRFSSSGNAIHHNLYIGNGENAFDGGSNQWDDGAEGNYWDDYSGSDQDNDTVGDSPYDIPGGGNQDHFPMIMSVASLEGSAMVLAGEEINFGEYDKTYDKGTVLLKSWDFDDSDGIQEDAVGNAPAHSYAWGGIRTVTLTIVGHRGYASTDTMDVFVVDEVLASITDTMGDVMNEDERVVGGHPDIDIIGVTMWRIGNDIIIKITVAGTIRPGPSGSNLYSYGVFFYLDERDNVNDPDDADYCLLWNTWYAALWNEHTGGHIIVDASGEGTSTMTVTIHQSSLNDKIDFRFDAISVYYIGFNEYGGTWEEVFVDFTVERGSASPSDVFWVALVIGGLILGPIALRLYLRSRRRKRKMGPGLGEEVTYYGPVVGGAETQEPPPQPPRGTPPRPP